MGGDGLGVGAGHAVGGHHGHEQFDPSSQTFQGLDGTYDNVHPVATMERISATTTSAAAIMGTAAAHPAADFHGGNGVDAHYGGYVNYQGQLAQAGNEFQSGNNDNSGNENRFAGYQATETAGDIELNW
ncbi:hypothetical protein SPI_00338 [Niveomyces insectorum RCEF 264]|uniref:Uncharacterized protein n=1 Tax=Niveomyces insectorum RCEF 264 TaxID=1081102 RepID=A0A168A1X5_9HYPO|nr:hypothetical protein SPI_00338 [Niveomyces insectorum RCEF 264]